MSSGRYYSISEVTKLVDRVGNGKLVRGLIIAKHIPHIDGNRGPMINDEGVELLRAALVEWDNRPRLSHLLAAAS